MKIQLQDMSGSAGNYPSGGVSGQSPLGMGNTFVAPSEAAGVEIQIAPDGQAEPDRLRAVILQVSARALGFRNEQDRPENSGQKYCSDDVFPMSGTPITTISSRSHTPAARPGPGAIDIGAGADGSVWMVGSDHRAYRLDGNGWAFMLAGPYSRVDVGPTGEAWLVTNNGVIHEKRAFAPVVTRPGKGLDIAVSANGEVFRVGQQGLIERFDHGDDSWPAVGWETPSSFARVTAGPAGQVAGTTSDRRIYILKRFLWPETLTGGFIDIGVSGDQGRPWVIAKNGGLYWWGSRGWMSMRRAQHRAVDAGIIADASGEVFFLTASSSISGGVWTSANGATARDVASNGRGDCCMVGCRTRRRANPTWPHPRGRSKTLASPVPTFATSKSRSVVERDLEVTPARRQPFDMREARWWNGRCMVGRTMSILRIILTAAPLALTLTACLDGEPEVPLEEGVDSQASDQSFEEEPAPVRVQLPDGAFIEFQAHRDGSYSVSEEGDAYHVPVMNRPEFEEGTPLMVYEAVTDADAEIPKSLVIHHEALIADGLAIETGARRPRGWLLPELDRSLPPLASNPCPGNVSSFVCSSSVSSYYPSGPGCSPYLLDATWNHNGSYRVRRYRTGFCTIGTVDAYIYGGYAGTSHPSCWAPRPLIVLRNGRYSNHNYAYWWSGPSGAWPRKFDNHVDRVSGSGFSWGVREKTQGSSCKI